MRTREKGMKDYNVPQEDYEELLKRCKKLNIEDGLHLFQCAISAAPGLEIAVYESITTGAGYRTIISRGRFIPCKEDDFYAYRRKTLATFYDRLRLFGKW